MRAAGQLAPVYSHTGRPSTDPVLMIRMLVIGYSLGAREALATADRYYAETRTLAHGPRRSLRVGLALWFSRGLGFSGSVSSSIPGAMTVDPMLCACTISPGTLYSKFSADREFRPLR